MKRSEFLGLLRAELVGQVQRADFEVQILDAVERLGMRPPPYTSKYWSRPDNEFIQLNEWEVESESDKPLKPE